VACRGFFGKREFKDFIVVRLVCGILQIPSPVGMVPEVFVFGVVGFPRNRDENVWAMA
jgi:hypothetical protein